MIVADRKPVSEILEMVSECSKILLLGCKGCVTVCNAGGLKEVQVLAATLKIARNREGRPLEVTEDVLERQCDPEYVEQIREQADQYDAVVSMACGVGPQFLAETYPDQKVFPALNTTFFGGAVSHGVWEERCQGCGTCIIHHFDGMCPVARCSKSLLHGPCGGSADGHCEIAKDVACIWDLIVRKKMAQDRLGDLLDIRLPKDWRTARDGGPRKSIREELTP